MIDRAAFTIALGKPIFLQMAIALARSFFLWNQGNGIGFAIVTDRPRSLCPRDLREVNWIEAPEGKYGAGFTPKLHLDLLAPARRSMFIDADCLVVRSLEDAFRRFEGHAVSVVGTNWSSGEWCGDVRRIADTLGLQHYPYLNGGLYYLEPGETATKVFATARELRLRYDELGLSRLRGKENDEPLISLGMATYGQEPIAEDGTVMNTLMDAVGGMKLDVLAGEAILYNPQDHPQRARGHSIPVLKPAIMHLNAMDVADYPYRTEVQHLELVCGRGWPPTAARVVTFFRSTLPAVIIGAAKDLLRPTYHRLLGPRSVRETVR